jgi:DNA-binding transcriptional regulator WhiA
MGDIYTYNTDFFKNIASKEEAYLFGYLWADGSIVEKQYCLKASNKEGDEYLTHLCQELIGGRVYIRSRQDTRFKNKDYKVWEFQANNKTIVNNLLKNNFRLNAHKIPDNLKHYFVRGFFDGDGCLYKNKKHYLYQLAFSSGNTDFQWLLETIPEKIRSGYTFTDNGVQIRWCGKKARAILDWIYSGESIGLMRKRKLYENEK